MDSSSHSLHLFAQSQSQKYNCTPLSPLELQALPRARLLNLAISSPKISIPLRQQITFGLPTLGFFHTHFFSQISTQPKTNTSLSDCLLFVLSHSDNSDTMDQSVHPTPPSSQPGSASSSPSITNPLIFNSSGTNKVLGDTAGPEGSSSLSPDPALDSKFSYFET